ncbi:MAG: globin [Streptosporangiales bacterium]|nr:globin [Streptosporangiales bacterium]
MSEQQASTFYEIVGGADTFRRLVDGFYARVADDPLLREMYTDDLAAASDHLRMFLEQYWGGPRTYGELRGHPRLRMRHVPFHIDRAAHDVWLRHMRAALDDVGLPPDRDQQLWTYLVMAAESLINVEDEPGDPPQGRSLPLA